MNAVDGSDDDASNGTMQSLVNAGVKEVVNNNDASNITGHPALEAGDVIKSAGTADVLDAAKTTTAQEVNKTSSAFVAGQKYEIVSFAPGQNTAAKTVNLATFRDVDAIGNASADIADGAVLAVWHTVYCGCYHYQRKSCTFKCPHFRHEVQEYSH